MKLHPSLTPERIFEACERRLSSLDNPGFCIACGADIEGVEPDACEYECEAVFHALKFLRPGGQLIAIMSAGTEFRETKKAIAFRALVASMNGKFRDLPAGSFSEVGTYVNTCYLQLQKPE